VQRCVSCTQLLTHCCCCCCCGVPPFSLVQVLLALWQVLGSCCMLQVETLLQGVLLRLADGGWVGSWTREEGARGGGGGG
jgi:hypothetical protein